MNRQHFGIMLAVIGLSLGSGWLAAQPDPAQLAWLDQQGIVLHWDNVETEPVPVGVSRPGYDRRDGLHVVELHPGDAVSLPLAAGEQLRLQSVQGRLDEGSFDLAWSNGSGLYLPAPLHFSVDGVTLVSSINSDRDGVLRIARPETHSGSIPVALFVSRHAERTSAASYRELISFPDLPALSLTDRRSEDTYWQLDSGQSVSLMVADKKRIRLDSRIILPGGGDVSGQAYRITALLDGIPWRVLEFESSLDSYSPVAVDGCFRPTGQRLSAYLEIPAGEHTLELVSNASIYLRLLEQQAFQDYLWEGNLPRQQKVVQQAFEARGSIWDQSEGQVRRAISSSNPSVPASRQSVLRLLQDNSWREGGLIGAALMRNWVRDYPEENEIRLLSQRAWSRHTEYRDLLPATHDQLIDQHFAWFRTPALFDAGRNLVVPENYAGNLSALMANGYFVQLPHGATAAYDYALPQRAAPSQLRIVVQRDAVGTDKRIYLQFDDKPPVPVVLSGGQDLQPRDWQAGRAEAALAVFNRAHDSRGATLAGPFALRNKSAPLLDVALLELTLPRDVQRIRVWADDKPGETVQLALQYRASRYYRLAGAAYQSLLGELGAASVYQQFLAALSAGVADEEHQPVPASAAGVGQAWDNRDAVRDLRNQWLPLIRLLYSRNDPLATSTEADSSSPGDGELPGEAELNLLQEAARRSEASGDLVAELEAWMAVARGATGIAREQAWMSQVQVLERAGEMYLAQQLLRRHLVGPGSDDFRHKVLERLQAYYRRAGNNEARLNVLATAVVRDPSPALFRQLAEVLLDLGKTHYALQLLLALPPAEQSRPLLMRASYTAGWWALFDQQLSSMPDNNRYHWWAGWREQAAGNYQRALFQWSKAGASAVAIRQQLEQGLAIKEQLSSPQRSLRAEAVKNWEDWVSHYPGGRRWRNEPQLVSRHGGSATVNVIDQDQSFTTYRASPRAPLTLQVQGPAVLRFSLRPLHSSVSGEAINDWVEIEDGGQKTPIPIIDNRAAHGLQVIGNEQETPGLAENFEYRVAAGLHKIKIAPERFTTLLRVDIAQPELPLAVLPPLLSDTYQAALSGELANARGRWPENITYQGVEVLRHCTLGKLSWDNWLVAAERGQVEPAIVRDSSPAHSVAASPSVSSPPSWRYHTVRRGDTLSEIAVTYGQRYPQIASLNNIEPPYLIRIGQRLRIGLSTLSVATDPGVHAEDERLRKQMRSILWQAERDESQSVAMAAVGIALFQQHPQVPGLQDMARRLLRLTSWELVSTVDSSAGVRVIEVAPGSSEAPAVRIRKALLPPLQAGEQLLSGFETLVFAVEQADASHYELTLTMADLSPAPARPLQVRVQLDDEGEQLVELTPGIPQQVLGQSIPEGQHLLRVGIASPVLSQYLRIAIREPGAESSSSSANRPGRRSYHVATREEPVLAYLEGPTRLRIDELRDGQTSYRYQDVPPGWQEVKLEAGTQRDQSLYRVYKLASRLPQAAVLARQPQWQPTAVPLPDASLPAEPGVALRKTIDRFALQGQEDGTWSLSAALVRRRNLDESGEQDADAEKFAELRASHRFYAPDKHSYFRGDVLTRLREDGGSTAGARGWVDIRRPDWPLDITLNSSLYAQRPDSDAGNQWAATVRGALSRHMEMTPQMAHRPAVTAFQRWLSMDEIQGQHPERVDQDLFTQYKRDHRRGLGLSDTLSYRPWLDTLWYGSLGVTSNEDFKVFDPDYISFNVGGKQLLNNWRISAEYQARYYFPDDDRDGSATRNRYQLSADWLGWRNDKHAWQAAMQVFWDESSNEFSGRIGISWHRSNARFYRDFRPGELGFQSLRERQLQEKFFATGAGGMGEQ